MEGLCLLANPASQGTDFCVSTVAPILSRRKYCSTGFFYCLDFFFLNSSFSILTPVSTNGYDLDHLLGPGALLNCAISQNVYNRGGIFICVRYL